MKKFLGILFLWIFSMVDVLAQCAMCGKVAEQNASDKALTEGINGGILWLMAFPYVLMGLAGYFLWKAYKRKQAKKLVEVQLDRD